jgi:hypothetical protein
VLLNRIQECLPILLIIHSTLISVLRILSSLQLNHRNLLRLAKDMQHQLVIRVTLLLLYKQNLGINRFLLCSPTPCTRILSRLMYNRAKNMLSILLLLTSKHWPYMVAN